MRIDMKKYTEKWKFPYLLFYSSELISISIAISEAEMVGFCLISSRILSELFFFLSELFSELL